MILNHGCLIGSLMFKAGYWIIKNQEKLEMVEKHLHNRAQGITSKAKALRENWENRNEQ